MITCTIGENAGRLWNILNETGEMTISQLMSSLAIDERSLFSAIGWLAREGKIYGREQDGELYFSNQLFEGFINFG